MASIDGKIKPEIEKLWHRYYHHYPPDPFAQLLESHVKPTDHVLEIGAGSGQGEQRHFDLKDRVAKYVGIDLDRRVLTNPYLDEAMIGDAEDLPFPDGSFDLVFHTMVAEHLPRPVTAMRETARVLKPGGSLLFETPNRFYYSMLIAAITPHRFHRFYVNKFGSGRTADEVFPTYYRINDKHTVIETIERCGMAASVQLISIPPGYLRFNKYAFLLGVLYERSVERMVPALRARLIVSARKPARAASADPEARSSAAEAVQPVPA